MISQLIDGLSKALYESLTDFHGVDKLVLCISLLMFAFGIAIAIYMYKQVQAANNKTMAIMERNELRHIEHAKEYKQLNEAGIVALNKVTDTIHEHTTILHKNNSLLESNQSILTLLIQKNIAS